MNHKARWRDIYPYDGVYKVSEYGEIKNAITGKILTQFLDKRGYHKVTLFGRDLNNKITRKVWSVHRLVALCFVPIYSLDRFQVNHIDEDKSNNRADNLEWATNLENAQHRTRINKFKYKFGDENNKARIGTQMVKKIKAMYNTGHYTQAELAEQFGISQGAISQITTNKIRKYD
jgi:DNA-binding XRE family transcriptional regulator